MGGGHTAGQSVLWAGILLANQKEASDLPQPSLSSNLTLCVVFVITEKEIICMEGFEIITNLSRREFAAVING